MQVKKEFETKLELAFCQDRPAVFDLDCKDFIKRLYAEAGGPTAFAWNFEHGGYFLKDAIYLKIDARLIDKIYPIVLLEFEIHDWDQMEEDEVTPTELFFTSCEVNLERCKSDRSMVKKLLAGAKKVVKSIDKSLKI